MPGNNWKEANFFENQNYFILSKILRWNLKKTQSKYIPLTEEIRFLYKQVCVMDFLIFLSEETTYYYFCDFLCLQFEDPCCPGQIALYTAVIVFSCYLTSQTREWNPE